jgi:phosphatidylserine/phosphatidylglycerophosphate/cardiolipin synthase-like enzyme
MSIKGSFSLIPVFSPDNSLEVVIDLIDSAKISIFVQQLYIYLDWGNDLNPLVKKLVEKAKQGVDVRVILNYNPFYDSTNIKCNLTKEYLQENGVKVKFLFTNWSYFTNVHNKGVVVDNKSVLISSINWNENSFTKNREAGIIVENESVAKYYSSVFFYDWSLSEPMEEHTAEAVENSSFDYKNTFYVVVIYTLTFAIVIRDWRKRKWT